MTKDPICAGFDEKSGNGVSPGCEGGRRLLQVALCDVADIDCRIVFNGAMATGSTNSCVGFIPVRRYAYGSSLESRLDPAPENRSFRDRH